MCLYGGYRISTSFIYLFIYFPFGEFVFCRSRSPPCCFGICFSARLFNNLCCKMLKMVTCTCTFLNGGLQWQAYLLCLLIEFTCMLINYFTVSEWLDINSLKTFIAFSFKNHISSEYSCTFLLFINILKVL